MLTREVMDKDSIQKLKEQGRARLLGKKLVEREIAFLEEELNKAMVQLSDSIPSDQALRLDPIVMKSMHEHHAQHAPTARPVLDIHMCQGYKDQLKPHEYAAVIYELVKLDILTRSILYPNRTSEDKLAIKADPSALPLATQQFMQANALAIEVAKKAAFLRALKEELIELYEVEVIHGNKEVKACYAEHCQPEDKLYVEVVIGEEQLRSFDKNRQKMAEAVAEFMSTAHPKAKETLEDNLMEDVAKYIERCKGIKFDKKKYPKEIFDLSEEELTNKFPDSAERELIAAINASRHKVIEEVIDSLAKMLPTKDHKSFASFDKNKLHYLMYVGDLHKLTHGIKMHAAKMGYSKDSLKHLKYRFQKAAKLFSPPSSLASSPARDIGQERAVPSPQGSPPHENSTSVMTALLRQASNPPSPTGTKPPSPTGSKPSSPTLSPKSLHAAAHPRATVTMEDDKGAESELNEGQLPTKEKDGDQFSMMHLLLSSLDSNAITVAMTALLLHQQGAPLHDLPDFIVRTYGGLQKNAGFKKEVSDLTPEARPPVGSWVKVTLLGSTPSPHALPLSSRRIPEDLPSPSGERFIGNKVVYRRQLPA